MHLQINFKNIVDNPNCRIIINSIELYSGIVLPNYDFKVDIPAGATTLKIEHWGKQPHDTVVENNCIVRDRSFELDKIIIDGYNLEELIWASEFQANDGAVYPSCLFFGPNGSYILNFTNPILYWILKSRHEKNNNDPHWEEDYNYYVNACQILKQIYHK